MRGLEPAHCNANGIMQGRAFVFVGVVVTNAAHEVDVTTLVGVTCEAQELVGIACGDDANVTASPERRCEVGIRNVDQLVDRHLNGVQPIDDGRVG